MPDYAIRRVKVKSVHIDQGQLTIELQMLSGENGEPVGDLYHGVSNSMGAADDEEVQNLATRLVAAVERVANGQMFDIHDPEGRQV